MFASQLPMTTEENYREELEALCWQEAQRIHASSSVDRDGSGDSPEPEISADALSKIKSLQGQIRVASDASLSLERVTRSEKLEESTTTPTKQDLDHIDTLGQEEKTTEDTATPQALSNDHTRADPLTKLLLSTRIS
ncbi:hypothetical protein EIP91_003365 [Steccherinum ochraceum]|uniref:Uncharacterized protein n=1 Tax=Steccherinum ochraceum TaxID=92696 RepID=A0A4R0RMD3_9APHY|nr:hypothetical protein EIP91_003365 [Steccherinum ochraceum]